MRKELQLFPENLQLLTTTEAETTEVVVVYGQYQQEKPMQFLKCGAAEEAAAEYVAVNKAAELDLVDMQLNQQV